MKFRYIGDYPAGQTSLTCFGVVFTPEAEVEVPEAFTARAQGNRFFVAVDANDVPAEDIPVAVDLKPALIEAAQERGIKIDKRWSADRIAKALEEPV